ncbi:unnamed protein product, partial [Allacma fusca]
TDNFENAKKGAELASVESEFELTDVEGTSLIQSRVLRNKTRKKIVKFHRSSSPVWPVSSNVASSTITGYEEPNLDVHIDGSNIFQAEELGIASLDIGSEYLTVTADHQLQTCNYHEDTGGQGNLDVASRLDLLLEEFQNFRQEFRNFQKVSLEKLVTLSKEFDHISLTLGRHLASFAQVEDLGLPLDVAFPLVDAKSLAALQLWLRVTENQNKLSNYLKGIGGSDLKDCVRRILERLFSPELARCVNFSGANKKISFKGHYLRSCLIASLRSSSQATFATEADVDKCVQKWFGGAGDRNGGRAERKKQQDKSKAVAECCDSE